MSALLVVCMQNEARLGKIAQILSQHGYTENHPDVLLMDKDEKMGVLNAKKIRDFLSTRPYSHKGRAVAVLSAHNFSEEAQNSLLKLIEEPPESSLVILGANHTQNILPTIISRSMVEYIPSAIDGSISEKFGQDIEKVLGSSLEERFAYIENLEDREEFLHALTYHFHKRLKANPDALGASKILLTAEEWASSSVNIRAILEYLMIRL